MCRAFGGGTGTERDGAALARREQPLEPGHGSELGAAPARRVCEVAYDHTGLVAGVLTSDRKTAATISWRSRPPTSWSASSAPATRAAPAPRRARDRIPERSV